MAVGCNCGSAGQDFGLDDTVDLGHLVEQVFDGDGQIHGFGGDGDNGGAVGGDDGIDGDDVGIGFRENAQDLGQQTCLVMQQQLEGDDPSGHHVLEGQHSIPVLVEGAAADIRHTGSLVDGGCLAGGKQALGLCHLQKHLRQSGCFHNKILRIFSHSNLLFRFRCTLCFHHSTDPGKCKDFSTGDGKMFCSCVHKEGYK